MPRIHTCLIAIVVVAALGVFSWTAVHAVFYNPDSGIAAPAIAATSKNVPLAQQPARFTVPSLNIDAAVQDLGVNALGNMQAPSNFTDVGWYKYGVAPGQIGSAVIDGHVDNGLGLAGVFKQLQNIKIGDDVYVQTNAGTRLHFVVSDIETYPYNAAPSNLIFGQTDMPRLNIITCEGSWLKGADTYDHRIVVFTKYVGDS